MFSFSPIYANFTLLDKFKIPRTKISAIAITKIVCIVNESFCFCKATAFKL